MFTAHALTGGSDYAANHLVHSDYYDEHNAVQGEWMGEGARLLGLTGEVKNGDFVSLINGEHPVTGGSLRMRSGGKKVDAEGRTVGNRCTANDGVFTAPKGVSIAAQIDPRLHEAHIESVKAAVAEIQRRAKVRDMSGGTEKFRPAMLVMSRYSHGQNRELEPNLHDHVITHNVAFDAATGTWRTVDNRIFYQEQALITEVYRAELARRVVGLGYGIHAHFNEKGKRLGWELDCISPELRTRNSTRSKQKEAGIAIELERRQKMLSEHAGHFSNSPLADWLAEKGEVWADESGKALSNNEVAKIVRETRSRKLTSISKAEVLAIGLAKMSPEERRLIETATEGVKIVAAGESLVVKNGKFVTAREAIEWALDHELERRSVTTESAVQRAALEHFHGLDLARARDAIIDLRNEGKLLVDIAGGTMCITTEEKIVEEDRMLSIVKGGIGSHEPLGKVGWRPKPDQKQPTKAQAKCLDDLLGSKDSVTCFTGAAGTGKTFTDQILRPAVEAYGRRLFAIAPTGSAAMELRKEVHAGAVTVAKTLVDAEMQGQIRSGDVILLDEAGAVSTRDMLAVLSLAKRCGARAVLQGDVFQLASVAYGDAMRNILTETATSRTTLSQIMRQQHNKSYKHAMKLLRNNPQEALEYMMGEGGKKKGTPKPMDVVTEIRDFDEYIASIAIKYFAEREVMRGNRKSSVLIVGSTHHINDSITEAIRMERIKRGEIDPAQEVNRVVLESTQWTEAQRRLTDGYKDNFIITFQDKFSEQFKRGQRAEVVKSEPKKLIIRNLATGVEVSVNPSQISKIADVSRRKAVRVAPGDKIILKRRGMLASVDKGGKPSMPRPCVNGEIGEVKGVNPKDGSILLKDGRIIEKTYADFDLAYAITIHKSQGKSVDSVIVAGEMSRELFYVACSRGKYALNIFTQSVTKLAAQIVKSGERQSAVALARSYVKEAKAAAQAQGRTFQAAGMAELAAKRAASRFDGKARFRGEDTLPGQSRRTPAPLPGGKGSL